MARRNHIVQPKSATKFTFKTLSRIATSVAILLGAATSTATKRPTLPIPTAETAELEMQVLLDRAHFSPGEIDGIGGENSSKALAAFQVERGFAPGSRNRAAVLQALAAGAVVEPVVSYTITTEDAAGPFSEKIPKNMIEMSKLSHLYYTSVLQELSEKFHSSPALLKRLNPSAGFTAGEQIRVPNVAQTEREALETQRARSGLVKVVVSKKASVLKVYDGKGQVIFFAPVTSGSVHFPLPFGNWKVTEILRNPTYDYDPELFWHPNPTSAKMTIAAGPNNPVGIVWIGISDPHYGIHGTPEPGEIGYSQSDGCVRLTNWDASRLAGLVTKGTRVVFEE
jgi:lipoprotein-anchoring transpeptidase ErfK/SrfK